LTATPCVSVEADIARDILRRLPPECASIRFTWLRVGAALKGIHPDLLPLFDSWSRQADNYGGTAELWDSLMGTGLDALVKIAAEFSIQPEDNPRPKVVRVSTDEAATVDSAAEVLKRSDCYQRGNLIVRVSRATPPPPKIARDPDAPRVDVLSPAALRDVLARHGYFERFDARAKEWTRCHISPWIVSNLQSRDAWPLPTLEAISEVPVLRADGSIIDRPGFDAESGVYFAPTTAFPAVPVEEARDALLAPFCDFPFHTEPDRSAWLASVLTPLSRLAFNGPAPVSLFDANSPGSGKTLLVKGTSIIATGRPMAVTPMPDSEAEWRKRITSLVIEGEPCVLIDNIHGELRSAALDAALTATEWSDRVLGLNKNVKLPIRISFFVTGNNVILGRDTRRRTNYCRLEVRYENPEQRSGFKHPDLLAYIREHRGYLTSCALSILRGYCAAGRPDQKLPPLGSFEGWSDLVRSAVTWIGLPDPIVTQTALQSSDSDTALLQQLLAGWQELGSPLTVAEALHAVHYHHDKYATLRAAVAEVDGRGGQKQALGMTLHKFRGRVCGGLCFAKGERGKQTVWRVEAA
jgi:putative DNA primase/helicase